MNAVLRPPPMTALEGFIPRPELLKSLLAGSERGLILLTAPGGYGKSWLAGEVARAWSSTLPASAPVRLWSVQGSGTTMQALRSFCRLFDAQGVPDSLDPAGVIDAALGAMARSAGPAGALIVDIDGAPPSKAVQSMIARIVLDFAPRGRALVACRNPWLLPIDRISMLAPLKILRASKLAMTAEEIAAAQSVGLPLAREWLRLTEGWPVICGGSSQWRGRHGGVLSDDTLTDRLVSLFADYMEHELLAPLAGRDIKLLMQVSIFDAIEPGLLQAIELGTNWSRLASLVESGLPVSGDQAGLDHIAINPIFRQFLQRRMLARMPALHHALHRRAAAYFAAAGSHRDALLHAAQTRDPVFQAEITESIGGWRSSWREGVSALAPSGSPNPELMERFPKAALARIYWQAQTGRVDDARTALDRLYAQQPGEALRNDLLAIKAVVSVYRDAPFDEAQVQLLGDLRHAAYEDEPLLFPSGATLQAAMLNNAGLYERGALTARAAIVEAEALGARYVEFYGHLQHGLALQGLGRVEGARACQLRASELARELYGEASGECRMIGLLIAHAAWMAGDDEQAEQAAGDLDGLYRLHAWFLPYARSLEVAQAIGRRRGGKVLEDRVLEDFSELAERRCLPRLQAFVALSRARQALAEGQVDLADRACDSAIAIVAQSLSAESIAGAWVLAPVWLEKARIALARGNFEDAAQALSEHRRVGGELRDGALAIEAGLLEAYIALRGRRYRDVSQQLTQCVLDAEAGGLRRGFLGNAQLVMELVGYARSHALKLDSRVLQRAADFARDGMRDRESSATPRLMQRTGLLLTERETDVLHFLAEGLSSKEMARRLAISEATVKTHRKHLYEKLNTGLRSQALVKARELGLL